MFQLIVLSINNRHLYFKKADINIQWDKP